MNCKQVYVDKKGTPFEPSSAKVKINEREQTYVIIRKDTEILCVYDNESGVFTLPKAGDVENLNLNPSSTFSTISYIKEKNRYYKEKQTFNVYELKSGKALGDILLWCSVEDMLVRKKPLDETIFNGFKNLYVRK